MNLNETYGKAEELLQQYEFLAERKRMLFILKIYKDLYFLIFISKLYTHAFLKGDVHNNVISQNRNHNNNS